MRQDTPSFGKSVAGFTLIELMIGLTLGLLVVGGVTAIFVSNSATRAEIEKTSRQIENGRYAMQLLTDDLRLAGYFAEFNPIPLTSPAARPDACATNLADLQAAMPLHVQGYDNVTTASKPGCISDVRPGTDVVVIRRTSTCVVGESGCDAVVAGKPYFQATMCNPKADSALAGTELAGMLAGRYVLDTDQTKFTLHKRNCTTVADRRQYKTHIYFIANNNRSGDGIPTLKRAELGAGSFAVVPLVEGIENLQFEYQFLAGATPVWTPSPDTYNSCAWNVCVNYWRGTTVVKMHLLARNIESSPGYQDTRQYNLGVDTAGNAVTVGPFGDAYRRHAYSATVRLINPAGRVQ